MDEGSVAGKVTSGKAAQFSLRLPGLCSVMLLKAGQSSESKAPL